MPHRLFCRPARSSSSGIIATYDDLTTKPTQLLEALDELHADAVIEPAYVRNDDTLRLVHDLNIDPEWRLRYSNDDGYVWLRQRR